MGSMEMGIMFSVASVNEHVSLIHNNNLLFIYSHKQTPTQLINLHMKRLTFKMRIGIKSVLDNL